MSWFEVAGGRTTCERCGYEAARYGHDCPRCGHAIGLSEGQIVGKGIGWTGKLVLFLLACACFYGAWTGDGIGLIGRVVFGLIGVGMLSVLFKRRSSR